MTNSFQRFNTMMFNHALESTSRNLVMDSITRKISYGKTVAPRRDNDAEDTSELEDSQVISSTVLQQKASPILPGKLAAGYPAHIRKEAHHTFSELLVATQKLSSSSKYRTVTLPAPWPPLS
jgi:hypothetical protein